MKRFLYEEKKLAFFGKEIGVLRKKMKVRVCFGRRGHVKKMKQRRMGIFVKKYYKLTESGSHRSYI